MNHTFTNFRVDFSNSRTFEGTFTESAPSRFSPLFIVNHFNLLAEKLKNSCFAKIAKITFISGCAFGALAILLSVLTAQLSVVSGSVLGGGILLLSLLSFFGK